MKRDRSGKIVATVGPASFSPDELEKLFLCGVDVFRLNFSHGTHDWHRSVHNSIRNIGRRYDHNTTILADLQGPKLRIGTFAKDKIILERGDIFRFDLSPVPGDTTRVGLLHPEIFEALEPGSTMLLDDGKLRFEVVKCDAEHAETRVLVGGPLSNRKGVNVPYVLLKIPALSAKDLKDLDFILGLGVEYIGMSFVQCAADVEKGRAIIKGKAKIISKIEKPMAIKELEPIIEISDAIMVARGDLGVEMDPEEVPPIQRRIINICHRMGRPVIVATQMLESMISAPAPTRAEVSDVATAVYSGADATMLSAESASGQYPMEAVSIMARVVRHVEADPSCIRRLEDDTQLPQPTVLDALCAAAKNAAEFSSAKALVLFTDSFESVVRCSRLRPRTPIVLVTESQEVAGQAGLCSGVSSILTKKETGEKSLEKAAKSLLEEYKIAAPGDTIVLLHPGERLVKLCQL
ncbi:MAG: pyruvate kinase [Holosporaceae bacterium]|jgi:pyruvate kinase|nr:pyruvate kinase [Holosporaceae bacterium]